MGGIQCLSAFLKQHGHETALVNDPNLFDNPWVYFPKLSSLLHNEEVILQEIAVQAPDLIGLSVVTDDYRWALRWARKIKSRMSVPIVLGNCYPTFHAEEALKELAFDFVIRGEGEWTLLELANCLERQGDFGHILGLGYKLHGRPQLNPLRPLIEDLDILPYPDKDLYYSSMPYLNHGYTTMTGRGCPYRCTFCDNTTSANMYREGTEKIQKWARRHSPQYVVNEILWAQERYKIKHVRFNDEDFSYNKRWTREFCELYKEKVGIPYFAWVYPNTIDEEIANQMAESGCDAVEMGIQSGAEHLRINILHRKTSDEQIITAMQAFRKAGIRATVDIILGLPTETKADLDATVDLLIRCRPWHVYVFWLRYYPSTEILAMAKQSRLLSSEQIHQLETAQHSRGHIAGGTELEKNPLSRKYHAFIVLLPLMPPGLARFFLNHDLIRFFPSFLNPFILVNLTKMIKRDPYNEFRVRGWLMIWVEGRKMLLQLVKRCTLQGLRWGGKVYSSTFSLGSQNSR